MFLRKDNAIYLQSLRAYPMCFSRFFLAYPLYSMFYASDFIHCSTSIEPQTEEDVGLLVQVGFDITAFRPPAYQRGSLPRPSKDDSS